MKQKQVHFVPHKAGKKGMYQSRNHTSACSLISHRELAKCTPQIHVKVKQDKNKKNREEKMPINKGKNGVLSNSVVSSLEFSQDTQRKKEKEKEKEKKDTSSKPVCPIQKKGRDKKKNKLR